MRTIDIFVSSPADVQKESAVAEQLIRSVAAEFNLPIKVSYSTPLRESKEEDEISVEREDFGDESTLVLGPCFWEYPDLEEDDFLEQIPNTGQYDLVICILWSRLGTTPPLECAMPDGTSPTSATDYEVAWALDQSKRTPGRPGLCVYRNRATPAAPLEPKEERENLCRHWDAVQEFCQAWERNAGPGFRECCHDYQELEEFENLFREHFRDFLTQQLDPAIASSKAQRTVPRLGSNPFRGLDFFDFEHAALYHGRTKAVGEVLDVLKHQAKAKKPFVVVTGPCGCGKSSFVRAGVLPLLARGATPVGSGPWRRAITRPGAADDPFDALAAALFAKSALPELQDAASPDNRRSLAFQLSQDPGIAAARIAQMLVKPKLQLALIVDQLEEVFTGFPPLLQGKYITALCALANCEGVFTIATLGSDFYPHYQRFPELIAFGGRYELQPPTPRGIGNMIRFPADAAGLHFEHDPETGRSLDEVILKAVVASPQSLPLLEHLLSRLYQRQLERKDGSLPWSDYLGLGGLQDALARHAEFVFLNLKSDEQQALDSVIQHLLVPSRGGEGFLHRRMVPYHDLVSSPKLSQRQRAGVKGLVDRLCKEGLLTADTDPNHELLISIPQEALLRRWPRLSQSLSEHRRFLRMRDRLDARLNLWLLRGCRRDNLLDRGLGLAEAEILLAVFGPLLTEREIDFIQKSLARRKPRRWTLQSIGLGAIVGLAVVAGFVGVERLNLENRRSNKQQTAEQAQQNTELADSQRRELENQRGALELELKEAETNLQQTQQIADFANRRRHALETELKDEREKLQLAQQNADVANTQRTALQAELTKAQDEKAQLAQQDTNLSNGQSSEQEAQRSLQTQLKDAQQKLQLAQQNADVANTQRTALQAELKKAQEEKAQLAQQNTNLANGQSSQQEAHRSLEAQLKDALEKLQLAQQNADLADTQRAALQAELKKAQEEKAQFAQQNTNLANGQSSQQEAQRSLEAQLKNAQQKLQLAQKDADLANTQRAALQAELTKAQDEKAQLDQQNTNLANGQSSEQEAQRSLEAQLKDAQQKLQLAQKDADLANTQRAALQTELKKAQDEKAQLDQQNTNLANGQSSEQEAQRSLEAQLKDEQEKVQQVQANADRTASQLSELEAQLSQAQKAQANADLATAERSALETQLKKAEEKEQLAQQNADLAASQRSALETQLKNEQVKLEQVQANADRTASQLSELEAQLSQAQKAQANPDFANSELRGMRLIERVTTPPRALAIQPAMNNRNSESGIGADSTFAWFMIGAKPEEMQDRLLREKYSLLNPPQDVSRKPSPSTKKSETSNPSESQFDRRAEASGEEQRVKEFVLGYLRTAASNDTSMQQRYFAEHVNFYGRGVLNSSKIEASTQRYHDEWPIRQWAPRGEAKVVRSSNAKLFVVYQPFNWTVSDGSHNAHGDATLYLRIRKNSQGEFRIVHVHQLDR